MDNVNITITISEELKNKLDSRKVNKSALFKNAAEKKLRILEQLKENETGISNEIIVKLKEESEGQSFQFGKDMCIEWIESGARYLSIVEVAKLVENKDVLSDLEDIIIEMLEKNESALEYMPVYEEKFSDENDGDILDCEAFAKGFTLEAKIVVNAIKNS